MPDPTDDGKSTLYVASQSRAGGFISHFFPYHFLFKSAELDKLSIGSGLPRGIAFDKCSNTVFIAESTSGVIRKIRFGSGINILENVVIYRTRGDRSHHLVYHLNLDRKNKHIYFTETNRLVLHSHHVIP